MQQPARLGMTLLIISESVFFFMLVVAFVAFRDQSVEVASQALSLPLGSLCTSCLLVGGFTAWRAARSVGRADGAGPRIWLVCTILLGALFLLGQAGEYRHLVNRGVTVSGSLFGTTFFTLTGVEALHVLVGIVLLLAMLPIAGAGQFSAIQPAERVQAVAAFWYFIGGVWIVIFSVVYLWTFL
jgi:heme/copper-type cytochrome/quinol oxidase subunit 3